jgi:hypothetical protein
MPEVEDRFNPGPYATPEQNARYHLHWQKKLWEASGLDSTEQEMGKPRSGFCPVLRLLQILPRSHDAQDHACRGVWLGDASLDSGGIARSGDTGWVECHRHD